MENFVTSKKSKFRDDHSRLIKFMENKKLIKKLNIKGVKFLLQMLIKFLIQ